MQEEILNDNKNVTANSQQVELLKKNFPQCFDKDGNFIVHKMEEIVGESGLELSKESYSLNWLGKSYARLLANENPRTLLKEDKKHNTKEQNKESQNLLIKGDNLEVLKHLSNAYAESIKMIYIDPPYNTGSDGFVYNDDRKFTSQELSRLADIDMDEAKRILEFTQSNANSHSAWLTFMYPRLYVARQLLKEEGVIFISIDENENAQLKILCDEVFGEENYAGEIVWKNSSKNDQSYISIQHEYIFVYVKSKAHNSGDWKEKKEGLDLIYKAFEKFRKKHGDDWGAIHKDALSWYKQFPASDPIMGSKHYTWMDEKGVYFPDNISGPNHGQYRYDVDHPVTKQVCKAPSSGWRYPEETMIQRIKDNLVHFGKDHTTVPNNKTYLKDTESQSLTSIKYQDGRVASKQLTKLMGGKYFTNPKDVSILIRLMKSIGVGNNDIVLDFFAGSGTTGQAVMELNVNEGSEVSFVLVQIRENLDEAYANAAGDGKKTIKNAIEFLGEHSKPHDVSELTQIRLKKASENIKKEHPNCKGDLGFKIYETMPVWDGYLDEIEKLEEDTTLFDGSKLNNEELEVLLTTWKVYDGLELSYELQGVELSDYKAHLGKGILYLVYSGFSTDALKALLEKLDSDPTFEPSRVVLFGYNFTSKAQRELDEALSSYANKKSIELDVVVRY
ncbi:hypothetical protein YH65_04095 [Sulfurovum lithotrophicum]|uniref:site-specific DNA-methyltransferase (adenine-specific) n=1 Tax=Sulfurovum lithotrophicum TaxID=206403 RepID=A0A7U4RQE1_9BACT|nr:site-specific DNA-methyltransferase [Sulfurovum lithotrophicum]AKF24656.1 hypothetical protein YH65_04095 [Sulfurovum lithotrophicum]